ncbi:MAG TPA: hypothetical protein VN612_00945 [Acidobacteriaceae bacterium]|nr:hypothetical protein [Acidobacteriaceae bacterium]
MSVATALVEKLETRLPKVIDARTHGVIDYAHAGFFLGMALVCRKRNPRAALAALCTGSFVLVQSLLTDYPLGAGKVIPFKTHGEMDAAFAASSFAMPRIFGFSDTGAAKVFRANGFVEGAVVGMTDFDTTRARIEELGSSLPAMDDRNQMAAD